MREPQERVSRSQVASHGGEVDGSGREHRVVQGGRHGQNGGRAGVGTAPGGRTGGVEVGPAPGGRAGGGEADPPAPSGSCCRPCTRAAGGRGWVTGGRRCRRERRFSTRGSWPLWLARATSPRVRQQRDGDSGATAPAGVLGYAIQATWPEARPTPAPYASRAPMEQLTTNWVSRKVKRPDTGCGIIVPAQDRVKITISDMTSTEIKYMRKRGKKRKHGETRGFMCRSQMYQRCGMPERRRGDWPTRLRRTRWAALSRFTRFPL